MDLVWVAAELSSGLVQASLSRELLQPIWTALIWGAARIKVLLGCRVTNPHEFEVDGVTFLGTSGQNLEDIDRYSTETERLPVLERLLEWGHLVPTAPDTLTAYSFPDRDPFVIDAAPHVLFAGNQPAFATRLVEGACILRCLKTQLHPVISQPLPLSNKHCTIAAGKVFFYFLIFMLTSEDGYLDRACVRVNVY